MAAFVPMETGAAAGADGSGRVSAGAAAGPGTRGALGWCAGHLVGGVVFGLGVGGKAKQEGKREVKNPDPDSLVSEEARRARGVPNLLYSSP